MSDKQRALAVLHVASRTCSALLDALRNPQPNVETPESITDASLDTKLNDYVSLLSMLHQNATKLAIALKPSSMAYSAAISPAKELTDHIDAFASCACSIREDEHGKTLAQEIRWLAEDVINTLQSLLAVYLDEDYPQGSDSSRGSGEPYLVRTGVVHEAIDRARGVSRTSREAVKKRWDGILGGLSDCEKEVQEMIEDVEDTEDSNLACLDEDSSWRELGGNTPSTEAKIFPSQKELVRLNTAHAMFKFTHALIKRIDLLILQPTSRMASPLPKTLDQLLLSADMLLKAADDLVHALYIPQDSDAVSQKSKDLAGFVNELRSELSSLDLVTQRRDGQENSDAITDLTERTSDVTLEGSHKANAGHAALLKERRWFNICFDRILKSSAGLVRKSE